MKNRKINTKVIIVTIAIAVAYIGILMWTLGNVQESFDRERTEKTHMLMGKIAQNIETAVDSEWNTLNQFVRVFNHHKQELLTSGKAECYISDSESWATKESVPHMFFLTPLEEEFTVEETTFTHMMISVEMSTFAQCDFLSTPDGYKWEQKFLSGEASFEEGMDQGITITEMLIDADAFDPEKYTASSSVDTNFVNRECAMIFEWSGMMKFRVASTAEGVTDENGFLPFYGLNGEKLANALRVLEWVTTPEAQELLKTDESQLSVTKDAESHLMRDVVISYVKAQTPLQAPEVLRK